MEWMVCARGEPREEKYLPRIRDLIHGVELQSYGLSGVQSEQAWNRVLENHLRIAPKITGRLALHGPFIGIEYGYSDYLLREAVRRRMDLTYEAVRRLKPDTLVLHTGYTEGVIQFHLDDHWLTNAVAFWREEILRYAALDVTVVLENLLEPAPDTLVALVDGVGHSNLGVCFDIGHWNVWSTLPVTRWLSALGHRLKHVHLHDNHGNLDEHLPVGEGAIDFQAFFDAAYDLTPDITISMEVDAEPDTVLRNLSDVLQRYRR